MSAEPLEQGFLEHVAKCSSQYDSACRRMAAEILSLRDELWRWREWAGRYLGDDDDSAMRDAISEKLERHAP